MAHGGCEAAVERERRRRRTEAAERPAARRRRIGMAASSFVGGGLEWWWWRDKGVGFLQTAVVKLVIFCEPVWALMVSG
jgi:hypothetical protein